jgi:hypothetical protein
VLAIQNADHGEARCLKQQKTGSGEIMIGGRCPSKHCIKKPRHVQNGVGTGCRVVLGSRGWSRGKKLELWSRNEEVCRHRRLIRIVLHRVPPGVSTLWEKGAGTLPGGAPKREPVSVVVGPRLVRT